MVHWNSLFRVRVRVRVRVRIRIRLTSYGLGFRVGFGHANGLGGKTRSSEK